MNKERKFTVGIIIDVLKVSTKLNPQMSRVIEHGIEGILNSEERAERAMEMYKDTANTAANYRNTVASINHLKSSLAAVVDGDLELAADHLEGAIDPIARQVHRAPAAKPTRRAR